MAAPVNADTRKFGTQHRLLISRGVALVSGLILLAGCAAVSEARKVQKAETLPPGERTVSARELGIDKSTVLSLKTAAEMALKYNPTVVQAGERLVSAQSQLASKKGSYYPQVSASVGTSRSASESSNSSSYSSGLSVSQYLYDFDKTDSQVRIYYYDALAAEYDLAQARKNITYSVNEAYYNVLRQISAVRLAEETVRQNEKYLEQAKAFFEVGTKIKYDITKAEVNLGNAQRRIRNISWKNHRWSYQELRPAWDRPSSYSYWPSPIIQRSRPRNQGLNHPALRSIVPLPRFGRPCHYQALTDSAAAISRSTGPGAYQPH